MLIGALLAFPSTALAQATGGAAPGNGPTAISGNGSSACNALVNSAAVQNANGWLTGLIVIIVGTPFKVAAVLSIVIMAIMLFLDSGHFGQHVKHILTAFITIMLVGLFVSFVFGSQVSLAQC